MQELEEFAYQNLRYAKRIPDAFLLNTKTNINDMTHKKASNEHHMTETQKPFWTFFPAKISDIFSDKNFGHFLNENIGYFSDKNFGHFLF